MEVRLADCAGFCFGVKRAVDTVYEQLKNGKTIYTYGPIVHNEEVVRELSEKGVRVLENKEDLKQLKAGENIPTVIIRAHGVAKEIYDIMEANGLECIDATCPFVKKIHRIVELKSNEGYHVIVVGDPKHPEVEGIVGWCPGPVTVLETPDQAENFVKTEGEKLCIVSQTTYNYNKFQYIVEIFEKKGYNDSVVNTICNATEERQRSAKAIAAEAGVELVDYFAREELILCNAIPTAEGCIGILMAERTRTLWNSAILLAGFGPVGQALGVRLAALGAQVTVAARRPAQRALAESFSLRAVDLARLEQTAPAFDTVVNTIPAPVLTEAVLTALRPGSLIVDLASRPGGTDFAAARRLGHPAIHALSLPAACAPETAGEALARTVCEILAEREETP